MRIDAKGNQAIEARPESERCALPSHFCQPRGCEIEPFRHVLVLWFKKSCPSLPSSFLRHNLLLRAARFRMAEAFAIIGLAANVAQFLEYCILFVSTTKNAYSSTRTAEGSNPERAVVAAEIKKHCWRITCFPTSSHANHSQDELSIGKIAEQCQSLADELLAVLDSLKPRPSPKFRSMEAIRVGLATLGKNKKIQELEERLNRLYRSLESSVGNVLQRYITPIRSSRNQPTNMPTETSIPE